MFNPKTLTLLSSIAVRTNKLNTGLDGRTESLVNKVLKNNEGKTHYVNSYNEGNKDRIYLMVYCNEMRKDSEASISEYNVFYFIDKDALSEKQIEEIKQEFQVQNGSYCIKKDFNNDIKYQKKFENKIKELGVDLYVFDFRRVQKYLQYLGNGLNVARNV